MREWIYGRNPVYETLRANRRSTFRLLVAQGAREKGRLAEIIHLCRDRNLPIEYAPRRQFEALTGEGQSGAQGVALESGGYPYIDLLDILDLAASRKQPPFVLILDALQDPQNLGALLRTAECVGVHGVLMPLRHTATITPAVVNASSGASEHLLVGQSNLSRAIERLKAANVWVVGLENDPEAQLPDQLRLDGSIALVVGNEGAGMRPLVRSGCDLLMRLPMRGRVESLNAAVAGSVALYMVWQAQNFE